MKAAWAKIIEEVEQGDSAQGNVIFAQDFLEAFALEGNKEDLAKCFKHLIKAAIIRDITLPEMERLIDNV